MSRTLDRTQAKFDKMPSVGADPVVESGSNVDGEWTRWADGTQICTVNGDLTASASAHILRYVWTFPVSFISTTLTFVSQTPRIAGFNGDRDKGSYVADSVTLSSVDLLRISNGGVDLTASAPQATTGVATGRWK